MRFSFRIFAASLATLAVAACSDSVVSPTATSTRSFSPAGPAFDYSGGGNNSFGDQGNDFRLTSSGGKFSVGMFDVVFPEGSICKSADAPLNANGSTNWDAPCETLGSRDGINVHAVARLTASGVAVDFTPHMRFAPSKTVTISTDLFSIFLRMNRDYFTKNPSALRVFALYYTPTLGAAAVADYISDPSLVTHVGLSSGVIWRRIKHTSGYLVGSGEPCDPGPNEPDCISVGRDQ